MINFQSPAVLAVCLGVTERLNLFVSGIYVYECCLILCVVGGLG